MSGGSSHGRSLRKDRLVSANPFTCAKRFVPEVRCCRRGRGLGYVVVHHDEESRVSSRYSIPARSLRVVRSRGDAGSGPERRQHDHHLPLLRRFEVHVAVSGEVRASRRNVRPSMSGLFAVYPLCSGQPRPEFPNLTVRT